LENVPLSRGEPSGLSCSEAWSRVQEATSETECPSELGQLCPVACRVCPSKVEYENKGVIIFAP